MRRHRAAVIEKRSAPGAAIQNGIADIQCGGATKVGTRVIDGATRVSRVAAKCAVVDPQCGVSSKVAVIVDAAAVERSCVAAHCAVADRQERGGYTTGVVDSAAQAVGRVAADGAVADRHIRRAAGVEHQDVNATAIISR